MKQSLPLLAVAALAAVFAGCRGTPATDNAEAAPQPDDVKHVVDSVIPMDVAMERFRVGLSEPAGFHGDVKSRDDLVARVIQALQDSDTTAFGDLAVNRAEWAWLYYPTTTLFKPPYELPPQLAWYQLQEANRKGVLRALRELGGHRVDLKGYTCDPEPTIQGENRLWSGCRVTLSRDGADPVTLGLFGAIVERGGVFEILSYHNDF